MSTTDRVLKARNPALARTDWTWGLLSPAGGTKKSLSFIYNSLFFIKTIKTDALPKSPETCIISKM
jgi:hypothetical protein